jgi:hypothetical protein
MLLTKRYHYDGFNDAVGKMAAATASPRTDHRGSAEYKREMVAVFVRRALSEAEGMRPFSARAQVNAATAPSGYPSPSAAGAAGTFLPPGGRPSRVPSILQGLKQTFRRHFF